MMAKTLTTAMIHVAYEKDAEQDEPGVVRYSETKASVTRRISALFGFKPGSIVLLEASMYGYRKGNKHYSYFDQMNFSVNGYGYWTNFYRLEMAPAYDDNPNN